MNPLQNEPIMNNPPPIYNNYSQHQMSSQFYPYQMIPPQPMPIPYYQNQPPNHVYGHMSQVFSQTPYPHTIDMRQSQIGSSIYPNIVETVQNNEFV